jgi:response regulator of citrate/malate metabolism
MIRTLVVEDDARVADVHRAYLERVPGFAPVGVVYRGTEALERLARGDVDLVLLDFYLPDMRGLDVCRAMHAWARPVDVIAVTAANDVDTVRAAVAQGVVQYLIKPFSFATFRDKLERYAAYRAGVGRPGQASQQEVDRLLGTLRGSTALPLPKGLSHETCDLVARVLEEKETELSASEVSDLAGLSRVTARRYLEYLAAEGRVELTKRYGGAGRPEHRYRWIAGAVS